MLHRSFGVTILLVAAIRFAIHLRTRLPPLPDGLPRLQHIAARGNAYVLYVMLTVQPPLGFTARLLHGDRIVLSGSFVLSSWLPADKPLAHRLFPIHGWTALTLLALIGVHSAAALYHQFIRKDAVLAGKLPGLRPSKLPAGACGGPP